MPAPPIQKLLDSYADVPLYQYSLKTSVAGSTPVFAFLDADGRVVGSVCASVSAIIASGGVEISLLSYYRQIIGDTTGASGLPAGAVGFILGRANGVQIGTNGRRDATVATGNVSGQLFAPNYLGLGQGFYLIPNRKSYPKSLTQAVNFAYTTWVTGTIGVSFFDRWGEQTAKGTSVACVSGTSYDIQDLGGLGSCGFVFFANTGVVYYDWTGDKSAAAGGELRIPANSALIFGTAPQTS